MIANMRCVMNGAPCGYGSQVSARINQVWSAMCYIFWEPDDKTAGSGQANEFNDAASSSEVACRARSPAVGCALAEDRNERRVYR